MMADLKPLYQYPSVRRDNSVVDERCGRKIVDYYRWLEDPDSEETKKFVESQNAVTSPYLDECLVRDKFNDR